MKFTANEKIYHGQEFQDWDFSELELKRISFTDCTFRGCRMSGLLTRSCVFTNCSFHFAELYESVHTYSAFINCEFGGANLFSSSWVQCKCAGSSFYNAKLKIGRAHV